MARYRRPERRLNSPETSRVPRQGSFIHTDLIAAPSSPGAMPPLPAASRGFALMLERAAAFIPVMARRRGSRLPPSVPMNHRPLPFPFGFFPVFGHNARIPQTLADPAGGRSRSPRSSSRNEGFDLFSPPLRDFLASQKRIAPPHPPLRSGPCGCGPDRPRQLIAIEAAMVAASNEKPKENDNG
jgi:hypothetical protein